MLTLYEGECEHVLKEFPENSIDSVVCDPPYGLSLFGCRWDYNVPSVSLWREVCRVLKPGGHLLAFSSTRTYHRMTVNIEDAGFHIRDQLAWMYSAGMPKSHNLHGEYEGMGTALKPCWEPIALARKPLVGTVLANVIQHGTGALNINACRVPIDALLDASQLRQMNRGQRLEDTAGQVWGYSKGDADRPQVVREDGRWPANIITDGSLEIEDSFSVFGTGLSRYFYSAKISQKERGDCKHPTMKPVALMRYLTRLVTPKKGIVLDPFAGSGTTGQAAMDEGFGAVLIERDPNYCKDIRNRLNLFL